MPCGNTACLGLPNSRAQDCRKSVTGTMGEDAGSGGQGGCVSTLSLFWEMPWFCSKAEWAPHLTPGFDLFPYRFITQTAGDPGGCVTLPRGSNRNLSLQESLEYPWGSQREGNEAIHHFCHTLPGQMNQTQGLSFERSTLSPLSGSLSDLLTPKMCRGAHASPRHNNSDSNKDNNDKSN